jgi:hypothetical protein
MKYQPKYKGMKQVIAIVFIFFLLSTEGIVCAKDFPGVVSGNDTSLIIINKNYNQSEVFFKSKSVQLTAIPDTSKDIIIIFRNADFKHYEIKGTELAADNKSLKYSAKSIIVSNNSKV